MQILPKLPTVTLRRRTDRVVMQETPILAFLGLGLFLWIFLTNSLPAKRDLAHRLAQVEIHAGEQGRLAMLREELSREESLAEAVREDPVVRQALYLREHPTAKPNDPELLLPPMSFELFPDDPDPIVEEWDLEGALPESELPSPDSHAGAGSSGHVPATEIEPTSGRIVRGSNSGQTLPRHSPANMVSTNQQQERKQQLTPKSTNSRPQAPEGTKRLGTSKPEGRPPQNQAGAGTTGRRTNPTPPAAKKPSAPGRFEIPNFLQG